MTRWIALSLALAAGISLAGCNTPQGQNAAGGALIGGATGATIGAVASGGRPGATIVGGVAGAAAGAMIGSAMTPQPGRCAQWGYDYYGNRVCTAYY